MHMSHASRPVRDRVRRERRPYVPKAPETGGSRGASRMRLPGIGGSGFLRTAAEDRRGKVFLEKTAMDRYNTYVWVFVTVSV